MAAEFMNTSDADENLFGIEDSFVYKARDVFITVLFVTRLLLYTFITTADIFLIYIVLRNKRLKTRVNIFIAHWCAMHAWIHVKDYLLFFLVFVIFNENIIYHCVDLQSHTTGMGLYFIFALIIGVDWLLSNNKTHLARVYRKHYLYLIILLYVIFGFEWIGSTVICIKHADRYDFKNYFSSYVTQVKARTIFYVVCLIIITVLNVLDKRLPVNRDRTKTAYARTVSNIIFYSFIPMLIYYIVDYYLTPHITLWYVFEFIDFIPDFLAACNNIVIIYYLGKNNKYFKIAYSRCFKRSVADYESEDLNESEEESAEEARENVSNNVVNDTDGQSSTAILVL